MTPAQARGWTSVRLATLRAILAAGFVLTVSVAVASDEQEKAQAATGSVELVVAGEEWQPRDERFTYWLFVENEIGPRSVVFEGGRRVVDSVPLGRAEHLYWATPYGSVRVSGRGPDNARATQALNVAWAPRPPGLEQERGGLGRPLTAMVVDERGIPIHEGDLVVWTFFEPAKFELWRWHDQRLFLVRGRGQEEDARRFLLELSVNRHRPTPGELVVGLQTPEHGMQWVARRELTPQQDYAGGDLGNLCFRAAPLIVSGQVLDDNEPVAGATVWVESLGENPEGSDPAFPRRQARSVG